MIRRTTLTYYDGSEDIIDHGGKLEGLMYPTKLEDFRLYDNKIITHIKSEAKAHYCSEDDPYVVDYDEDVNPFVVMAMKQEALEIMNKAPTLSREKFLTLHQYNYKSHIKNKL